MSTPPPLPNIPADIRARDKTPGYLWMSNSVNSANSVPRHQDNANAVFGGNNLALCRSSQGHSRNHSRSSSNGSMKDLGDRSSTAESLLADGLPPATRIPPVRVGSMIWEYPLGEPLGDLVRCGGLPRELEQLTFGPAMTQVRFPRCRSPFSAANDDEPMLDSGRVSFYPRPSLSSVSSPSGIVVLVRFPCISPVIHAHLLTFAALVARQFHAQRAILAPPPLPPSGFTFTWCHVSYIKAGGFVGEQFSQYKESIDQQAGFRSELRVTRRFS